MIYYILYYYILEGTKRNRKIITIKQFFFRGYFLSLLYYYYYCCLSVSCFCFICTFFSSLLTFYHWRGSSTGPRGLHVITHTAHIIYNILFSKPLTRVTATLLIRPVFSIVSTMYKIIIIIFHRRFYKSYTAV